MLLERSDLADAATLLRAIERQLPGVVTAAGSGDWFLFYDPDGTTDPEQRFPFCTLVTNDHYDTPSRLDRDETTYRVSLGVDRRTYEDLFGPAPAHADGHEVLDTGFDYTATDALLPHPFYAAVHWVCVVNPGDQTREQLATLLVQAHDLAKQRYEKQG